MADIDTVVIHCSATPNRREDTAEDIHRWHSKKWDGIGYHYVIERSGDVRPGRPHYWQGAHVAGHNEGSLGICLIGTDEYTDAQWRSLEGLVISLDRQYPGVRFLGHRDLDSGKSCPNFDAASYVAGVLDSRE